MADDDSDFYVGTSSGDILQVNTNNKVMTKYGPQKKKFILVSSSSVTWIFSLSSSLLVTEK